MASVALGIAGAKLATSGLGLAATATGTLVASGVGAAVGGYLDQAFLFPAFFGKEGSQESRYGSVTVSTADEGTPIYTAFGRRVRVPGLILFGADLREVEVTQRVGKRKVQAPSTYYTDIAVGFAKSYPATEGALDDILAIFADGTPIVDLREDIRIETITGASGSGDGRRAGLVANWQEHAGNGLGIPTETSVSLRHTGTLTETDLTVTAAAFDPAADNVVVTFDLPHGVTAGSGLFLKLSSGSPGGPDPYDYAWARASLTNTRQAVIPRLPTGLLNLNPPQARFWELRNPSALIGLTFTVVGSVADGDPLGDLRVLQPGKSTVVDVGGVRVYPSAPYAQAGNDVVRAIRGIQGNIQEVVLGGVLSSNYPETSGVPVVITQERTDYDVDVLEGASSNVEFSFAVDGVAEQEVNATLATWVSGNPCPAFRDQLYVVLSDVNISSYGNRAPNLEAIVASSRTSLAEVLTDICKHHGLTSEQIDVASLPEITVEGYRYAGLVEGTQALQPLMVVYDLLAQQKGDALRFFRRQDAEVIPIDGNEFVRGGSGERLTFRRVEGQRPLRSVSVSFLDVNNNLEVGTVSESGDAGQDGEDRAIDTNMAMDEDRAREIAQRVLRDSTQALWRIECSLPWTRSEILENDIISTTVNGMAHRFRVIGIDVGAEMELVIEGITEPEFPPIVEAEAAESVPTPEGERVIRTQESVSAHVWLGMDWESGRYREGGFFAAATSSTPGGRFSGASVFVSADNGTTWRLAGAIRGRSAIGRVVAPSHSLGESTRDAWEPSRSIVVALDDGELETATEQEARGAGSNLALVGREVVAFEAATELPGLEYRLQGFQRGAGKTVAGGHSVGEPFVEIGESVQRIDLLDDEAGRTVAVRVVPAGSTIDQGEEFLLQAPRRSDREIIAEPVEVRGFALSQQGEEVTLSWLPADAAEVEYYEIRLGPKWMGSRVVGRTSQTSFRWRPPTAGALQYLIRARFRGGLWSPTASSASVSFTDPDYSYEVAQLFPPLESVGGVGQNATNSNRDVTIDDGFYEGVWTQNPLDAGAVGTFWWDVHWTGYFEDLRTIDELPPIIPATADGMTWTGEGREGSPSYPGVGDWSTPADYQLPAENYQDVYGYGLRGSYGDPTSVLIEARFDTTGGGDWTDWAVFEPQWREARKIEVRATLRRFSLRVQQHLTALTPRAST